MKLFMPCTVLWCAVLLLQAMEWLALLALHPRTRISATNPAVPGSRRSCRRAWPQPVAHGLARRDADRQYKGMVLDRSPPLLVQQSRLQTSALGSCTVRCTVGGCQNDRLRVRMTYCTVDSAGQDCAVCCRAGRGLADRAESIM